MQRTDYIHRSRKRMLTDNFIGGISWGLGVAIGSVFVLGVLGFIMSQVNTVPIVGEFVGEVIQFIETNQPQDFQNVDNNSAQ